ncbi:FAD binding domain-containing protein [Pseudooceanicola aestuarii]|uniref:FAD binding domain-containing protein n=1 Tax=Pseudooceanicola aestuarii TaxID=2697319 RepID=UPI0013D766FD|nr:xanthine dehydrogenase family protein subunit M [Pseudooceanicola aestuarii]
MHNFEFVKPGSVDEAVKALSDPDAVVLSGGQTLLPTMKARLAAPATLVSLTGIAGLDHITQGAGTLEIGGATPHARVAAEAGASFPALAALAGRIGDPAVRNRGTIGGSVANNDPAACYPAAVLGTGATVITDRREVAADDFFQGLFTTALEEGEIVTGVRFPVPRAAHYAKFEQPASRFALVGVFVARFDDAVRVAVTGAGQDGVFRWTEAETALAADFSEAALDGLTVPAEGMNTDLHGTGAYRAHLVGVMTARAVAGAMAG